MSSKIINIALAFALGVAIGIATGSLIIAVIVGALTQLGFALDDIAYKIERLTEVIEEIEVVEAERNE